MQADTGVQIPRPDNTGHPFLPPPCNIFPFPTLFSSACRAPYACVSRFEHPEPIGEEAKGSKGLFEKSCVYLMTLRGADVVKGDYFQTEVMN